MAENSVYKVNDVRELTRLTPAGTEVTVYRVWLTTSKGSTGAVDVGEDDWNEEDLPGILQAKANTLDLAYTV